MTAPLPPTPPTREPPRAIVSGHIESRGVTLPLLTRLLARAIRWRCPQCGRGRMMDHWLRAARACDFCGLETERGESDHFLGAMMVNLVVAEGVFTVAMLTWILLTWPDPPWTWLTYGGALLMASLPFIFYPFTKMAWLAVDLLFRPVGEED